MITTPVKDILRHSEALSSSPPDESVIIPALVYTWTGLLRYLKPEPWSYDMFVREKLKVWVEDPEPLDEGEEPILEGGEGTIADASYIARGSEIHRTT